MFAGIGELVLVPAHEEYGQIGQSLVDLGGMRRIAEDGFSPTLPLRNVLNETEAPGKGSLVSVDLMIEEVTHANKASDGSHGNGQTVQEP